MRRLAHRLEAHLATAPTALAEAARAALVAAGFTAVASDVEAGRIRLAANRDAAGAEPPGDLAGRLKATLARHLGNRR